MKPMNKDGSPWTKEASSELCRVLRAECKEELSRVPKYENGIPGDVINDLYLHRLATYCREPKDEKDERKRLRLDRRAKDIEATIGATSDRAKAAENAIKESRPSKPESASRTAAVPPNRSTESTKAMST